MGEYFSKLDPKEQEIVTQITERFLWERLNGQTVGHTYQTGKVVDRDRFARDNAVAQNP